MKIFRAEAIAAGTGAAGVLFVYAAQEAAARALAAKTIAKPIKYFRNSALAMSPPLSQPIRILSQAFLLRLLLD